MPLPLCLSSPVLQNGCLKKENGDVNPANVQESWFLGFRIFVRHNPTRVLLMRTYNGLHGSLSHLLVCICTVQTCSLVYVCVHKFHKFCFSLSKILMLCYISSLYIYHETIDENLSLNQGCVWKEGMLLYRTKQKWWVSFGSSLQPGSTARGNVSQIW